MSNNKFEQSIINIIDRIEEVKLLIAHAESSLKRERLIQELNRLKAIREFYIEKFEETRSRHTSFIGKKGRKENM